MIVRRTTFAVCAMLAVASGPRRARAAETPGIVEVEGRIADDRGEPVAGADAVARRHPGGRRETAFADAQGNFRFPGLLAGTHRIEVFTPQGRPVAAAVIVVGDRGVRRLFISVRGAAVEVFEVADVNAGVAVVPPWRPVRNRDLADWVSALPAGAPAGPRGPALLGATQGEIGLAVDGIDLRDPATGAVPMTLPLALFSRMGAVPVTDGFEDQGAAVTIRLAAGGPTRLRALQIRAGAAGTADGAWHTDDGGGRVRDAQSPSAVAELNSGFELAGGQGAVSLGVAPQVRDRRFKQAAARGDVDGIRRHDLVPALLHAALRTRRWLIRATALAFRERIADDERPRVGLSGDTRRLTRGLLAGAAAATGRFRQTLVHLPATILLTRNDASLFDGRLTTDAGRVAVAPSVSAAADLGGAHVGRLGVDLRRWWAIRNGPQRGRFGAPAAERTGADGQALALVVSDRFRPAAFMEVELGVRVETVGITGSTDAPVVDSGTDLGFDPLPAPWLVGRFVHPGTRAMLTVGAGRHVWMPPLEPALAGLAARRQDLDVPHADQVHAGMTWPLGSLTLGLSGLLRRTGAILEDRIDPLTGSPELANPRVRRRYRAVVAQARWTAARHRAFASYVLASQQGDYTGYGDPDLGAYRPGVTPQGDLIWLAINRDGPLPFDQRHAARAGWGYGRAVTWAGAGGFADCALAGRVDSGAPLSARGRDAFGGPAQAFLVPRGTLGRTPWTGTVDAAAGVTRSWRDGRVGLRLEVFNLLNTRSALARSTIYTDDVVVPQAGSTPAGLADVTRPDGSAVSAASDFQATTAAMAPFLARLLFVFEI